MADKIYVKGIIAFPPHERAPKFIREGLTINIQQFMEWFETEGRKYVQHHEKYGDQLKLQILEGKEGRLNITVDTYQK